MIAVDTNVLIYACDQADPRRQKVALDLITNGQDGVLLWQVACEFLSASRKLGKQGFTSTHAWNRLGEFQDLLPLALPSDGNLARAKELHLTRGASLWDALILAACVEAGVETFYSEDLPGFDDLDGRPHRQPVQVATVGGAEEETQGQGAVGPPPAVAAISRLALYFSAAAVAVTPQPIERPDVVPAGQMPDGAAVCAAP